MSGNDGYLDFNEVNTLARQAVDLLLPQAHLTIEETPRSNAYIYPQAAGGDHGSWRVTVTIAPGNSAVFGLDSRSSRAAALGNLIVELGAACQHMFRGKFFPECPGHSHPAEVKVQGDAVLLVCPDDEHENATLLPDARKADQDSGSVVPQLGARCRPGPVAASESRYK